MCGIVGVFSREKKIEKSHLIEATRRLSHRGPDGEGVWLSSCGRIGLGHRRLSIVDIEGGQQPLVSSDNQICVSVNGEFYDDAIIRSQLEEKGYKFRTRSDSELLIHLYQEYGLDCVHKLRGEFAFILFDAKQHKIIAARDRFGIKPLCYHFSQEGECVLASEAKALLAFGIKAQWNDYAFFHTSCFQYKALDQTLFKDIFQILPGQLLIYDGKKIELKQYWDLDYPLSTDVEKLHTLSDFEVLLQDKFSEAIACRLRADEDKLCCHLSGGIDSASIASFASEIRGKPLPCFSVSFSHDQYDESHLACNLAKHINAPLQLVKVEEKDIIKVLSDAVYYSESFAINAHLAAKYILNQEIKRQGFKIALSGEGADELFLGYPHFKHDFLEGNVGALFEKNPLVNGVQITQEPSLSLAAVNEELGFIPHFFKAKAAIGLKVHQLLTKEFKQKFSIDKVFSEALTKWGISEQLKNRDNIHKSTYLWIKYALASYILKALGDGCEMAHGIEGRVPFLDHHLFELVKKIPSQLKIYQQKEKYILREIVKDKVTYEIYNRQKHAFMAPPLGLLKSKLGMEFANDELRSKDFRKNPFYDFSKVGQFLDSFSSKNFQAHISSEPVLMILLTSHLFGKRYGL